MAMPTLVRFELPLDQLFGLGRQRYVGGGISSYSCSGTAAVQPAPYCSQLES